MKRTMQDALRQRKARIIVGGHKKLQGVNYSDTFAPNPTFSSLPEADQSKQRKVSSGLLLG
ncbi:uncharacterized protein VP01_1010g1 [Puccinia sorghi]|uniref:Uncharacterized protein n=1 Tax=Puccinia sorghi TaxID=27349 RepID=A0A0L6VV94_9BASI|nr:uncharacterized protein VP01_1010g1 [Puccinia sorghi]